MRSFDYLEPRTMEEASALLAEHGDKAALLAGGTDLLVKMQEDKRPAQLLISLAGIAGLDAVSFDRHSGLVLGAAVPIDRMVACSAVRESYPVLACAGAQIGSRQIRNRGTVGGNLCNASPAADLAPPLLAYGASLRVFGGGRRRLIPLTEFFRGPGQTALGKGEILESVLVPPGPAAGVYIKHTVRKAMDLAIVGIAILLRMDRDVCHEARMALGAVAPVPMRVWAVEKFLTGRLLAEDVLEKAGCLAAETIKPISDIRASAEYRREMVRVLTKRAIRQASQREPRRDA